MFVQMPRLAAGFIVLAAAWAAAAQPRNAVYGEAGGAGVFPTANYERRLTGHVAARIGLSILGAESISRVYPLLGASYISHPARRHHFEAGGAALFVLSDDEDFFDFDDDSSASNAAFSGLLGYRFERPNGGFMFRGAITPLYTEGEWYPFAGLAFGYSW